MFSTSHLADVLIALYPGNSKMRGFVNFLREKGNKTEFKSVTFSSTTNGKRSEHNYQQIAVQIITCKLEGVTNGEEFLNWLVSSIFLWIGLTNI